MAERCRKPTRECPWTFERTLAMGERLKGIENGIAEIRDKTRAQEQRLETIEEKVDGLGHVKKRGARAGAIGGGAFAGLAYLGYLIWSVVEAAIASRGD